jgi:hypothetical protein
MKLHAMTHRKFLQLFLLATLWLTALTMPAASASGTTYYVDVNHPQAEDSSDHGSINKPWKTIQYALEQLQAGDTLFVRGGVYYEKIVRTGNSGTEEAPITVKAYPGEKVIVQGDQDGTLLHTLSGQGWIIEDIIFEDRPILGNGPGISQAIDAGGAKTYRTYLPVVMKGGGQTYYVDATGGNDAHTGRDPANAWRTLSKVYNEFTNGTFSGGDRILFKRGETWTADYTARLRVRNVSGTSEERPLYIGAYGTGEKPWIDARHATWSYLLGSGVDGNDVPVDHVIVEDLALMGDNSHSTYLDGVRGWTLRRVDVDKMIQIRRSEYVVLDGCDITSWDSEPVYIGTADDWTDQPGWVEIINCHIHDCPLECIDLKPGAHHVTIRDNVLRNADNEVVSLRGTYHVVQGNVISNPTGSMGIAGWSPGGAEGWLIEGNLIKDIHGEGGGGNGEGIRIRGANHTVRNNTVADCVTCLKVVKSNGVTIRDNIFYDSEIGIRLEGAELLDSDYNCFYSLIDDLDLADYGSYQPVSRACANNRIECNSITADPNFLDETDYEIDATSPCYGAGEGGVNIGYFEPVASTPTPTKTPLPTYTPTPTPTKTPLPTYTPTATNTPASTNTPLPTDTQTLTPTSTPTPTPTQTLLPTYTSTATNTPLPTYTPTPTSTSIPSPTNTPTSLPTNTPTFAPTNTPTLTPISTPTPTATNTPLPTYTPTPT